MVTLLIGRCRSFGIGSAVSQDVEHSRDRITSRHVSRISYRRFPTSPVGLGSPGKICSSSTTRRWLRSGLGGKLDLGGSVASAPG